MIIHSADWYEHGSCLDLQNTLSRHYKTLKPAYIWKYLGASPIKPPKKYFFRAEPPCISHHMEYPPGYSPPSPCSQTTAASLGSGSLPPICLFVVFFFAPFFPPSLPSSSPTLARVLFNWFYLPVLHWSLLNRYTVTYLPISLHKFHGSYEHECHGLKASRYCSFWCWWYLAK